MIVHEHHVTLNINRENDIWIHSGFQDTTFVFAFFRVLNLTNLNFTKRQKLRPQVAYEFIHTKISVGWLYQVEKKNSMNSSLCYSFVLSEMSNINGVVLLPSYLLMWYKYFILPHFALSCKKWPPKTQLTDFATMWALCKRVLYEKILSTTGPRELTMEGVRVEAHLLFPSIVTGWHKNPVKSFLRLLPMNFTNIHINFTLCVSETEEGILNLNLWSLQPWPSCRGPWCPVVHKSQVGCRWSTQRMEVQYLPALSVPSLDPKKCGNILKLKSRLNIA